MDVLSINQKYEINGGSDRYYFNMNQLLSERDNVVYEFAASGNLENESDFKKYFSKQVNFSLSNPKNLANYLYNFEAKKSLSLLLDEIVKPELAHLQIYYGQLTVSILDELRKRKIPIVQTLHEYKLSCPVYTHLSHGNICHACNNNSTISCVTKRCKDDSFIKSFVRYIEFNFSKWKGDRELVDQFICVSNFQKQLMLKAGIPSEKLNVVYNFVQAKDIAFSSKNSGYYLYFGRLGELKGLKTLLESAKILPHINFVIAGNGPFENNIKSFIENHKLKNIDFVGFKQGQALWELVKNSKAVLVPSEWFENCSMTVLEAKAYCKPVIASSIGGITEQIVDGENGFLHTAKSVVSLASAIDKLESLSSQDYVLMCNQSREDLDRRYSADVHYGNLIEVYKKVI